MKKMKLFYKLCAMLLLCGCLYACAKTYEVMIDQETKDYCLFGQGSYWIYQDSITFKIDSIFINDPIIHTLVENGGYDTWIWEDYYTRISLYSTDTVYNFSNQLSSKYADEKSLTPCILWSLNGAQYHNGAIGKDVYQLIYRNKKNNYLINKTTFNDVKTFMHYYYASKPKANQKEIYYWAKHIGLIREEIYVNDSIVSVRNLIRYNVKPYKP